MSPLLAGLAWLLVFHSLGRAVSRYVLDALRVRDRRARGFAMGLAVHGIGTARAFRVAQAGAYAGLAFGLHSLLLAVLPPLAWSGLAPG